MHPEQVATVTYPHHVRDAACWCHPVLEHRGGDLFIYHRYVMLAPDDQSRAFVLMNRLADGPPV